MSRAFLCFLALFSLLSCQDDRPCVSSPRSEGWSLHLEGLTGRAGQGTVRARTLAVTEEGVRLAGLTMATAAVEISAPRAKLVPGEGLYLDGPVTGEGARLALWSQGLWLKSSGAMTLVGPLRLRLPWGHVTARGGQYSDAALHLEGIRASVTFSQP